MSTILDFVWAVFHPSFWPIGNSYSEEWDKKMNELMKTEVFKKVEWGVWSLGNMHIRVSDYPYSFGTGVGVLERVRPSRRTVKKLHEHLVRSCVREGDLG